MRNFIININSNLKTSSLIEELVLIIDQNLPPKAFMNHEQSNVPTIVVVNHCFMSLFGTNSILSDIVIR